MISKLSVSMTLHYKFIGKLKNILKTTKNAWNEMKIRFQNLISGFYFSFSPAHRSGKYFKPASEIAFHDKYAWNTYTTISVFPISRLKPCRKLRKLSVPTTWGLRALSYQHILGILSLISKCINIQSRRTIPKSALPSSTNQHTII